jgi:hypothetical protein
MRAERLRVHLRGGVPGAYPRATLLALGVASIIVYALGITARYPLVPGLQDPRGTWATLVGSSPVALAAHIGVYALLTGLYILALGHLRRSATTRSAPVIVGVWLACALVLLGAYPGGESHDIFDYTFRGRMVAEHGASPLAVRPSAFSREPYYLYTSWHSNVDTYGPLWEYASATVAAGVGGLLWLTGGWAGAAQTCPDSPESCRALVAYLTGYRALAIGMAGVSGALIVAIVRRVRPAEADAALLAWLWNPVVLVGTAIGAHNDALLLVPLLLGLSLFQQRRWLGGLLALALAAHVKLTALLVAPVLGAWLLRQAGWQRTLTLGAAALAISVPASWLLYAPLGGWATLPRMLEERGLFLAASPANVVYRWLYDTQGWGAPDARVAVQRAATLLFAGVALALLLRMDRAARRSGDVDHLWRAGADVSLAYLLVGSFWFQHWYLLWALAPAALLPRSTMAERILPWYGFGALCVNVASSFAGAPGAPQLSRLTLATIEVIVIVAPLAFALALDVGRALRPGRDRAGPVGTCASSVRPDPTRRL